MRPPAGMAELRRVGRRPDRLREVEPLLAGQLVELVAGWGRPAARRPRSPGQPSGTARRSVGPVRVVAVAAGSRMATMPDRFTSARFVGREREFARLADALDAAAAGRPATLLLADSGGLGTAASSTRPSDGSPVWPSRSRSIRCRPTDARERRSVRPRRARASSALVADLADPELADGSWRPAPRSWSACCLARRRASPASGLLPARPMVIEPERRQTSRARSRPRRPLSSGGADVRSWSSSRTSIASTPATRSLADLPRPGVARPARSASWRPTSPTTSSGSPAPRHPRRHGDGSRPPGATTLQPLGRDELAELIDGVEGERPSASVLLLVAERSRGSPLRRRGAAGRSARALGRLADRIARRPRDGPIVRSLARVSPCPAAARPGRRPGDRVDELAAASAAFERMADDRRHARPPRRVAVTGCSMPTWRRASPRRSSTASSWSSEARLAAWTARAACSPRAGAGSAMSSSGGPSSPTCCPHLRPRHHAAVAAAAVDRPAVAVPHWLAAHQPAAARAAAIAAAEEAAAMRRAGRRPGVAGARPRADRRGRSRSTGPGVRAPPPVATICRCSRRRPPRRRSRRAGRPAPSRSPRPPSRPSTSAGTGSGWPSCRSDSVSTVGRRATTTGRSWRSGAPSASCLVRRARSGPASWGRWPSC